MLQAHACCSNNTNNGNLFTSKPKKLKLKHFRRAVFDSFCTYLEELANGGEDACTTLGSVLATLTRFVGPRVKLMMGGFTEGATDPVGGVARRMVGGN